MTGKRKRYSADFKAKVALEAIRGEMTLAQLAAKHGIHQTMINAWKKQAMEGMSGVFSGKAEAAQADRGGTGDPRSHDGREADRTDTENRCVRTWGDLQRIEDRTGTGLKSTAEGCEEFQRKIGGDFYDIALICQSIGREGRLPEKMAMDRLVLSCTVRPVKRIAAIQPRAAEADLEGMLAIGVAPGAAVAALLTGRKRENDGIACLDALHASADLLDDPGAFVAKDQR